MAGNVKTDAIDFVFIQNLKIIPSGLKWHSREMSNPELSLIWSAGVTYNSIMSLHNGKEALRLLLRELLSGYR